MRKQHSCSYFKPVLWVDWGKEGNVFTRSVVQKENAQRTFSGFATSIMLFNVGHMKTIVGN